MDGSFACPECGSEVEVEGVAPGRQVRCGFCHRLLEVPYLPRAPVATWKRQRFGQSRWFRWTLRGLAAVVVVAALIGAVRLVGRQYRSVQEGSIKELLIKSRTHEAAGQLDLALIDLDTALDLIRRSGASASFSLEEEQRRRGDLVRREAESILVSLMQDRREPFPLGDWLNLIARSKKDPDLSSLGPRVRDEFQRNVRQGTTTELGVAQRDFRSGRVLASLQACDRIAKLLPHLSKEAAAEVRQDTQALVERLVETHGVAIDTPKGDFVLGTYESYRALLLPTLLQTLESKGYLPNRDTSPWKSVWQKALYQLRMEVSEHREGTYLSSQNRVTRIASHLILTSREKKVWETYPSARTIVPMPGLPAYLATQVAVSPERSEKFERLLYENARDQILDKFSNAVNNMPACCP
jgi:hypothetical protein